MQKMKEYLKEKYLKGYEEYVRSRIIAEKNEGGKMFSIWDKKLQAVFTNKFIKI